MYKIDNNIVNGFRQNQAWHAAHPPKRPDWCSFKWAWRTVPCRMLWAALASQPMLDWVFFLNKLRYRSIGFHQFLTKGSHLLCRHFQIVAKLKKDTIITTKPYCKRSMYIYITYYYQYILSCTNTQRLRDYETLQRFV